MYRPFKNFIESFNRELLRIENCRYQLHRDISRLDNRLINIANSHKIQLNRHIGKISTQNQINYLYKNLEKLEEELNKKFHNK